MTNHDERERLAAWLEARAGLEDLNDDDGEEAANYRAAARLLREPVNARLLEALTMIVKRDDWTSGECRHCAREAIAAAESAPSEPVNAKAEDAAYERGYKDGYNAPHLEPPKYSDAAAESALRETPQDAHNLAEVLLERNAECNRLTARVKELTEEVRLLHHYSDDEQDGGERCMECMRLYATVYRVPDEVWRKLDRPPMARGAGLLCPTCCDRLAREQGITLYWEAAVNEFPTLAAPRVGVEEVIARLRGPECGVYDPDAERILRECWPAAVEGKGA